MELQVYFYSVVFVSKVAHLLVVLFQQSGSQVCGSAELILGKKIFIYSLHSTDQLETYYSISSHLVMLLYFLSYSCNASSTKLDNHV